MIQVYFLKTLWATAQNNNYHLTSVPLHSSLFCCLQIIIIFFCQIRGLPQFSSFLTPQLQLTVNLLLKLPLTRSSIKVHFSDSPLNSQPSFCSLYQFIFFLSAKWRCSSDSVFPLLCFYFEKCVHHYNIILKLMPPVLTNTWLSGFWIGTSSEDISTWISHHHFKLSVYKAHPSSVLLFYYSPYSHFPSNHLIKSSFSRPLSNLSPSE